MSPLLLTEKEADRFASYLEQDAASSEGLAVQAERLGTVGATMAKKLKAEALASRTVAAKLRATERATIEPQGEEIKS